MIHLLTLTEFTEMEHQTTHVQMSTVDLLNIEWCSSMHGTPAPTPEQALGRELSYDQTHNSEIG